MWLNLLSFSIWFDYFVCRNPQSEPRKLLTSEPAPLMSRRREGGIVFETVDDDDDVKRFLVSKYASRVSV
jgi:hypothetical protein